MRIPRPKITVSYMLFIVAMIAAFLAGVESRHSDLMRIWNELASARGELTLELEQADLALTQGVSITQAADLDRVEQLLDELETYEGRVVPVDTAASEQ